ncbi:MAG: hypothetical protein A2017_07860 [Lentisphaerae bacterium GWF2_44_16]|nr:MAG: hypothetical protein A2017_07860 [Lentisphaerae bacterium GWF2_44_16]
MEEGKKVAIYFSQGTLLLEGAEEAVNPIYRYLKLDPRVKMYRAQSYNYGPIIRKLHGGAIPYEDNAKSFMPLELKLKNAFAPRTHQTEALEAWLSAQGRGIVVMPTGAGKSYFAVMAINRIKRPSLIVVPTIELMEQWASQLEKFFGRKTGMLGGGSKEISEITVSTYDSAVLQMEFIGNRFGLVIFDECHHLPGPVNRMAASMCIAPYRMGLTATPERDDGGEDILHELIGPIVYQIHIDELEGKVLAPYRTRRILLELEPDEAAEYAEARKTYTSFIRANNIDFGDKTGWSKFIGLCARLPHGRKAFEAYLTQKRIARSSRSKFRKIWDIMREHRGERIIVFTAENETAYKLGEYFLLPVLTHRTKISERKEFLDKFRQGDYPVLITSKVLNEGVDVPEASVGIIVSGSASIREHVQRLGRILRAQKGKEAVLYELVSEGTSEMSVSKRRREHRAYKRFNKI